MRVFSLTTLVSVALAFLTVACDSGAPKPRAIHPETDICLECQMTVIPEGHASEAVDKQGTVSTFDDPGCLVLYVHDHPKPYVGASFFVQDEQTKDWIAWDKAIFVRADDVSTPMNYGWHAFATLDRAQAFSALHAGSRLVTSDTQIVLWNDLKARR